MKFEAVCDHFREQVGFCRAAGSPFTAQLLERLLTDLEAGGPVAELIGDWPRNPRADALSVRLAAALHAAVLTGRDHALAAHYPEQCGEVRIDAVWPLARALLARDRSWVADFIASPPQTNEVRRSIALLPGFLTFARGFDGDIDALELGASAGLNLNWDRFHYRTAHWSWGPPGGVAIDTDWHGPPPAVDVVPRVHTRAACDLSPLDVNDRAQRLRLRAYIWADQSERLARFDAAADLAVSTGLWVERADAAHWLAARLAARAPRRGTIVYHSFFLQYLRRSARMAITASIEDAGAQATERAPLAWLRLEPEAMLGGPPDSVRVIVDLVTWPGGQRRMLAVVEGHVHAVFAADA